MDAATLSNACAVDQRIYVLFPGELRITMYSQQVRAIRLVEALREEAWLRGRTSVAVIGGGASGITAAACLMLAELRDDLQVTLFESLETILPLQSACHDKLLAPHIIDWPAPASSNDLAALPLLSWRKDIAANVAVDIREQFDRLGVQVETGATVQRIDVLDDGVELAVVKAGETRLQRFGMVIVAAGFGLEVKPKGIINATNSYWRVNPRQAPALHAPEYRRILISGLGDGGLIDFVLFACPELTHSNLCERIVNSADTEPLLPHIRRIEEEAWAVAANVYDIHAAYDALPLDDLARSVLVPHLVQNVSFTLMTRGPCLLSRNTAPLNRLAAMLVIRAFRLRGGVDEVRKIINAEHREDEAGQTVWRVNGQDHRENFEDVVVRHGDTSSEAWSFGNPAIDRKVDLLRSQRAAISVRAETPGLDDAVTAKIGARLLSHLHTRIRMTRREGRVRWQGDLHPDDVGQLWRAASAEIHAEIDFAPGASPSRLDLAICRLLVHAEPVAQLIGEFAPLWIALMETVPRRAGDKTRAPSERFGRSSPSRNVVVEEDDRLAERIEAALDVGLISAIDGRMAKIVADTYQSPFALHVSLHENLATDWATWKSETLNLPSRERQWVLRLFGGLIDARGLPDAWSGVRVGPKCIDDEVLPAIILHLVLRNIFSGFGRTAEMPGGNVIRVDDAGSAIRPAYFCGTRWMMDAEGRPRSIEEWEGEWPGEPWLPSCLILASRRAEFLPDTTMTRTKPALGMLAMPWKRTPIVHRSIALERALRGGLAQTSAHINALLYAAANEVL